MSKKTLLSLSLFLQICMFSQSATFAGEVRSTFDQEVANCISDIKIEDRKCLNGRCPWIDKAQPCFDKIGLSKKYCPFEDFYFSCSPHVTDMLFPQTKNCLLEVRLHKNGDFNSAFRQMPDNGSACYLHGVQIGKGSAVVALTERQLDNSWRIPKPVLALHLDQHIKPSDIIAESITLEDTTGHGYSDDRERQLSYIPIERQETLRQHFNIRKREGPKPQRNFVGRNGPKKFLRIINFELKNDLNICSMTLPKRTTLTLVENSSGALVDGTIDMLGIPKYLIPKFAHLKNQKIDPTDTTNCIPISEKFLDIENFHRDLTIYPLPKVPSINWNKCDCDVSAPPTD